MNLIVSFTNIAQELKIKSCVNMVNVVSENVDNKFSFPSFEFSFNEIRDLLNHFWIKHQYHSNYQQLL